MVDHLYTVANWVLNSILAYLFTHVILIIIHSALASCVFSPFVSWHVRAIGINILRRHLFPKERVCSQLRLLLCGITHELPQDVAPTHQVIHLLRRQVALGDQALQTGELVGSVSFVGTELLKGLDVVLCVLVLQSRSDGLGLLGSVGP